MMQKLPVAVGTIIIALLVWAPLFAQSAPYFQGKTILLIQGREPGGTGALRVRAAAAERRRITFIATPNPMVSPSAT